MVIVVYKKAILTYKLYLKISYTKLYFVADVNYVLDVLTQKKQQLEAVSGKNSSVCYANVPCYVLVP